MFRPQGLHALALAFMAAASCAAPAIAASNSVVVSGLADIWLAGQPAGTILNGGFPSSDVAPTNSPVPASAGLNLTAGSYLTVSATGSTDYNGCASPTPDGGGPCGVFTAPGALSISAYKGPANALVGVFLDANVPSGVAPAGLDFSTPASQAQASLSPLLNQVFFIGDGLTGTGTGTVQRFVIPAGATRLFLASADGVGANYNNSGSFSVVVADAVGPAAVPAVSPANLVLMALMLAAGGAYLLANRARARAHARRPDA